MIQNENAGTSVVSVLDGLIPSRKELAQQLKRHERTIIRYERAGMPVIVLGMTRAYDPQKVRAWIVAHERNTAPRKVGRPAGKKAA